MLVIVDYDTGNTQNVKKALDYLNIENQLSADSAVIEAADGLILPGVGAFKKAMLALEERNLVIPIQQAAANKKPILGICLGMQLLFESSLEFGETSGLGLIDGRVEAIPADFSVKVPHMGWDQNRVIQDDPIAARFAGESSYFVHSFYANTRPENVLAVCDYGVALPSIVRNDNVIGMQFHPEKSGAVGLRGLAAFKELVENGNYSRN